MPRSTSFAIIVVLSCLLCCQALPDGAPEKACEKLAPQHGKHEPQKTPSPFKFTAANSGNKITVTISSTNVTQELKGFLLAPEDSAGKRIYGKFIEKSDVKGVSCDSKDNSAATHVNDDSKKSVVIEWIPPADFKGPVSFRGSVAETGKIFWVDIKSQPVTV